MPTSFAIENDGSFIAFPTHSANAHEQVLATYGDIVNDSDLFPHVAEALHDSIFAKIPGLPDPLQIRSLVVLLNKDRTGTAYINELKAGVQARVTHDVAPGDPVYTSSFSDITNVSLGIDIPDDVAVIVYLCMGWRRTLYYDFGPFTPEASRIGPMGEIVARQLLWLFRLSSTVVPRQRVDAMADGLLELRRLLEEKCQEEARYQEVIARNSWMLGGGYSAVRRHAKMDDRSIPDFTATRSSDGIDEIIEIKQPFLKCFVANGDFSSDFHKSWSQADRYTVFSREHRSYLWDEKKIRCENSKCILIMGWGWNEDQIKNAYRKESTSNSVKLMTYEHLLNQATTVLSLMRTASTFTDEL